MCRSSSGLPAHFNPRSPHGERLQALVFPVIGIISIHAPRTGSDALQEIKAILLEEFQSTLPARGATVGKCGAHHGEANFNPRSPHGERQAVTIEMRKHGHISIHAPRTGSDVGKEELYHRLKNISIHAPRTGSDER